MMDLEGSTSSDGTIVPETLSPAPAAEGSSLGKAGFVLVVAADTAQASAQAMLRRDGFDSHCIDEPYTAMVELLARPLVYRAVVLSLQGLYREELSIIRAVATRLPHVEVWLTHTDGRQAALAEAVRLGAVALIAEDGLHRIAEESADAAEHAKLNALAAQSANAHRQELTDTLAATREAIEDNTPISEMAGDDPILTADELRALLADPPSPEGVR
jgi:DNA-binding NtrC family response regulator